MNKMGAILGIIIGLVVGWFACGMFVGDTFNAALYKCEGDVVIIRVPKSRM